MKALDDETAVALVAAVPDIDRVSATRSWPQIRLSEAGADA